MSELILGGGPTEGPQNRERAAPGGSPLGPRRAGGRLGTTGTGHRTAWPQWLRRASRPPDPSVSLLTEEKPQALARGHCGLSLQ